MGVCTKDAQGSESGDGGGVGLSAQGSAEGLVVALSVTPFLAIKWSDGLGFVLFSKRWQVLLAAYSRQACAARRLSHCFVSCQF